VRGEVDAEPCSAVSFSLSVDARTLLGGVLSQGLFLIMSLVSTSPTHKFVHMRNGDQILNAQIYEGEDTAAAAHGLKAMASDTTTTYMRRTKGSYQGTAPDPDAGLSAKEKDKKRYARRTRNRDRKFSEDSVDGGY